MPAKTLRVEARRLDLDRVRREIVGDPRAPAGSSPSDTQNPSASSSSWPGVRIVTATGSPPMRISSGSSTATRSARSACREPQRVDRRVEYGGASATRRAYSGRAEALPEMRCLS